MQLSGLRLAIGGALVAASVSTFADYVWTNWITRHRPLYGVTHGTLLFLCVGLYLGVVTSKPLVGAVGGAAVGFLAAGGFYVLQPLLGYTGMFVLWVALWLMLGVLNGMILRDGRTLRRPLVHGATSAIGSGLAFYAISGIWLNPPPGGPNYLVNFVMWTIAFVPAFLPLLLAKYPQEARQVLGRPG